jgi:hypothetical protein
LKKFQQFNITKILKKNGRISGASLRKPGFAGFRVSALAARSILCAWRRKERTDPSGLTRPSNPLRGRVTDGFPVNSPSFF